MFGFLEDAIDNTLSILDGLAEGETPSRRQVVRLISDGVSIAAIASAAGVAEDVIRAVIDDE